MFQNIYLAAVKEKIIPHKVNETMKNFLNATAIGERTQSELNYPKTKGWSLFKSWGGGEREDIEGHLCLLIGLP